MRTRPRHWPSLSFPFLMTLGLAGLSLPAGPLWGQGILLDARVRVSLPTTPGPVEVEINYRILPEAGVEELPLSILTPEPTRLLELSAGLSINEVRDHFWEGTAQLPGGGLPGSPAETGGDTLSLHIGYRVAGAWDPSGRISLPLMAARWVPVEPTPQTFQADVEVPRGLTITGSFPTSVLMRPDPGEGGIFRVGLQGVPSMLVLWVAEGEGPLFTPERAMDGLVVVLLIVMVALGLRYLAGRDR